MSIMCQILSFVNNAEENVIKSALPTGKAAEGLIASRPFTMIGELDAVPGLGKASILSLIRAADTAPESEPEPEGWTPFDVKEIHEQASIWWDGEVSWEVNFYRSYYFKNKEKCLEAYKQMIKRAVEEGYRYSKEKTCLMIYKNPKKKKRGVIPK